MKSPTRFFNGTAAERTALTQTANLDATTPYAPRIFFETDTQSLYIDIDGLGWIQISGGGGGGSALTVREEDGTPLDAAITTIRVPNTSLTVNAAGDVSLGYELAGAVAAHVADVDPHTQYATVTDLALHAHTGGADGAAVDHASLTNVTADQHHAKSHTHNGDGSGTVPYSALSGIPSSFSVLVDEDGVNVDTASHINFIEPDATLVTDSPAGTARVDVSKYALLGGRSGGQTLNGGTSASQNLTLSSTVNATKGKILFGTSGYNESNNRLGIGTAAPNTQLHISQTSITGYGVNLFHLLSTFPAGAGENSSLSITAQAVPSAAGSSTDILEGISMALDLSPSANWNGGGRASYSIVQHNSQGTTNVGFMTGHEVLLQQNLASSTVTTMSGLIVTMQYKAGTTTTARGLVVNRGVASDAGAVGTSIGILIPASVAVTPTTDIAIQSQGGQNRFAGATIVGADAAPLSGLAFQVTGAAGLAAANELRFYNAGNTQYVGFKGPNAAANKIWTLPLVDGSSTNVLRTDGSGTLSFGAVAYSELTGVPTTRTAVKWVTTADMWPSIGSTGAARRLYNGATNAVNTPTLDFPDGAAASYVEWIMKLDDWNGGTFTYKVVWMANSTDTSKTVHFDLAARAYGDGSTLDQALGASQSVEDTIVNATANQVLISAASSGVTAGGSPAAGQLLRMRLQRDPTSANDNLPVDARVLGLLITYTQTL